MVKVRGYLDLSAGGGFGCLLGAAARDSNRDPGGSWVAGPEQGLQPEPPKPRARLAVCCGSDHVIFCFAGHGEAPGRGVGMKVQRFGQHGVELVGTRGAGWSEHPIGLQRAFCFVVWRW